MKTMQFTRNMICACFLMSGIVLNAQTQDAVKGWAAIAAQPQPSNASPGRTTAPPDLGKPWPPMSILGSWHLTGTFMGAPYETVMTFLPSETNDQGAVIFTSNQDQGPPASGTAGQGNWTKIGPDSFVATHLTFLFYIPTSTPIGILKIVDAITLKGNQMIMKSQIIFPAACGCGPFEADTTGTRVTIEAP
jgi:hypothetical protein